MQLWSSSDTASSKFADVSVSCLHVKVEVEKYLSLQTGKIIKAKHSKEVVQISKSFDCQTTNLVYIIDCKKCGEQYIGQTKNTLEKRFKQHLGYVANNTQATGQHFNLPTHNSSHMTISVLEKVHQKTRHHREQRESHWIEKFNTKYKGMNKKSW